MFKLYILTGNTTEALLPLYVLEGMSLWAQQIIFQNSPLGSGYGLDLQILLPVLTSEELNLPLEYYCTCLD